ncbi:hypothetical protein Hte_011658 [Hypoxylon texense]
MSSSHVVDDTRGDGLPPLVSRFTQALENYQRSHRTFEVLSTISANDSSLEARRPPVPPKTILVLDSSFNPPTLAHKRMALSALFEGARAGSTHSDQALRILLLLAINNADKAPKPAAFPQRLAMMQIFGADLLSDIAAADPDGDTYQRAGVDVDVDVAVTTEPYFHAKAAAVAGSGFYQGAGTAGDVPEQVYLAGFDTLVRIFDPKYYRPAGPDAMARALDPFFARARLRVTARTDDAWGGAAAQEAYLEELRRGGLERVGGGTAGWAGRIEMVGGRKDGEEVVSSTKVREAVRRRDWEALKKLVSEGVAEWIQEQGLYAAEASS